MSLFPKSKLDYMTAVKSLRVQLVQTFGLEPAPRGGLAGCRR